VGRGVGEVLVAFRVVGWAKTRENYVFATKINDINLELSENFQRYVNECCESESDGKIDGFLAGCCKRRAGVAIKAYRQSTAETAALKATVDTLTKQLDEHIIFPALPHLDPATSPSAMEEMTMQLSHIQHDIQDVLEAVRNPPGKRKRRGSDQNTGPTTPTNQRPATNKKRDASPEHSLMHSQHATSTTQDALDALMRKYPPRPLAITSTEAMTDPLPDSNAAQDTNLPDAPTTTAPAEKNGWKTVEGKAAQKKRKNDKADNKWGMTTANNTPTTKNGARSKNTHQPRTNTPSAKKTWAEVVKSRGINVQIVLGVRHHHTDMRIWGRQHTGKFFVLVQAIPLEVYRMFLCGVAFSRVMMGSGIQG
jgi:hypothetical protein